MIPLYWLRLDKRNLFHSILLLSDLGQCSQIFVVQYKSSDKQMAWRQGSNPVEAAFDSL